MNRFFETVFYAFLIIAALAVIFAFVLSATYISHPDDLKPGDKVAVLLDQTVVVDGQPCRVNLVGFVSPTGPDGENYWHKINFPVWPTDRYISVITVDEQRLWHLESQLVKLPADPSYLLCSTK